jgi:hypothetical protein
MNLNLSVSGTKLDHVSNIVVLQDVQTTVVKETNTEPEQEQTATNIQGIEKQVNVLTLFKALAETTTCILHCTNSLRQRKHPKKV